MPWKTAPLWRTLLLAALLFASLGSAFAVDGFGTEIREAAEAEPLGTLTVPVPHIGDAGEYRYALYNRTSGLPVLVQEATWSFRWGEPLRLPDRTGTLRDYDRLELPGSFPGLDGEAGAWKGATIRIEFTDATEYRVAGRLLEGDSPDGFDGCSGGCPETNTSYRRVVQHYDTSYLGRTPCGLLNQLQGATADLESGPIQVLHPCNWPEGRIPEEYQATRWMEGNDHRFAVLSREAEGPEWDEVWFSPDIPYPVRYVAERGTNETPYQAVLSLDRFTRGDRPLASWGIPPAKTLPLKTATFTGPDEDDIEHDFPLSVAWETLLDHPDASPVRTFLADHPDAYLAYAWYGRYSEDVDGNIERSSEVRHTWWTLLSDGMEGLQANITRTVRNASLQVYDAGPVPGTDDREVLDAVETFDMETPGHPDPEQIPQGLPAVKTLWDRWERSTQSGERPNGWGFSVYCLDDCGEVRAVLGAGFVDDYSRYEGGGGPSVGPNGISVFSGPQESSSGHSEDLYYVDVATDGSNPWAMFYQNVKAIHDADSPPPAAPEAVYSEATPVEAAVRTYEVRVWNPPPVEVVAGAGAVALALVLLHHFFPGFFRLFTRVRTDQALEHQVRSELHEAIRAEPGIHVRALSRRLDTPRGTVEHHLRKLEQLDLVKSRVQGRHRAYFPVDAPRRVLEAAPAMRSAGAQRLLAALSDGRTASVSDLARASGLAVATVHHHIGRLEAAGLVRSDRRPGVPAEISLTDLGRGTGVTAA